MTATPSTITRRRDPALIANELRFLRALADTGFVPAIIAATEDTLTLEYIEQQPSPDADALLVGCCGLLATMRERGIVHGDLTEYNLRVRDNCPVAIDFAESRFAGDPGEDKRPGGDAPWLWRAYTALTSDPRRHARRWLAIRERLALHGCRSLLDLGCARGDMVLMAQADGYEAAGVDRAPQAFIAPKVAVADMMPLRFRSDAMLLLSVLPYLLAQRGQAAVEAWLGALECRALYVECQMAGDGPGPQAFRTVADVAEFLGQFGAVTPLLTISLPDRGAQRTTFEVLR